MKKRNDDIYIRQNRYYAECDLQCNDADQQLESVFNIGWIILFLYNPEYIKYSDQSQPGKPAMDEDNRLWGFKKIDPRVEKIGRNQFAKHEGPGIRNMTCFESCGHAAVGDLNDKDNERCI